MPNSWGYCLYGGNIEKLYLTHTLLAPAFPKLAAGDVQTCAEKGADMRSSFWADPGCHLMVAHCFEARRSEKAAQLVD